MKSKRSCPTTTCRWTLPPTDDVAVALAEVEYRVNRGDPVREPIAATGYKNRVATAKETFGLAGKVKPGDMIEYRIRVSDNRPPEFGGPHVRLLPGRPRPGPARRQRQGDRRPARRNQRPPGKDQGGPQGGGARRLQDHAATRATGRP